MLCHNKEKAMAVSRADSRRRLVVVWLVIAVVIAGSCRFWWWFAEYHVCAYETGFTYGSGRYLAQASMRDCGATTIWNTRVTVSTPAFFGLPGTYQSAVVFQSTHNPTTLSLRWESATHLIIEY